MERGVREPVVSGSFYPAQPVRLREMVSDFLGPCLGASSASSVAVIVPHAGYVYSGRVAGTGLRAASAFGEPEVVLVLGASHTGAGGVLSLPEDAAWRTPLGDVALDLPGMSRAGPLGIGHEQAAFRREHSIEVVLPFLQVLFPTVPPVLPVCVQLGSWEELRRGADVLGEAIGTRRVWVIASSDFTHYDPDSMARAADRSALALILAGDAEGFHRVVVERGLTICGAGAIVVLLLLSRKFGLARSTLAAYATSGDVTGDRSAVVGYASVLFTKEKE